MPVPPTPRWADVTLSSLNAGLPLIVFEKTKRRNDNFSTISERVKAKAKLTNQEKTNLGGPWA